MNKIFKISVLHPWKVIIGFVLMTMVFAYPIQYLEQIADVSVIVDADMEIMVTRDNMEKIYGDSNFVVIAISKDAFTTEVLTEIAKVSNLLQQRKEIRKVSSIYNTDHIQGTDDSFEVGELLESIPANAVEIQDLKNKLKTVPSYKGNIISLDESGAGLLIEFVTGVVDETMFNIISDILTKTGNEAWSVSGLPIINTEIKHYMDSDLNTLLPLFFIFIIIVLYFAFKSLQGVFVALCNIVFTIVITLGTMALLGIPLNVVTNIIPMILIAITSSYGIHYLTHYYIEKGLYTNNEVVIMSTTTQIKGIIFLSGLTTFIAFAANGYSDVKAVREFGFFIAIGVAFSVFATLFLSPAVLTLLNRKSKGKNKNEAENQQENMLEQPEHDADVEFDESGLLNKGLINASGIILRYPFLLMLLMVTIFSVFGYKSMDVEADYRLLGYFDDDSEIVSDARIASKHFGGVTGFEFDIDTGVENGVLTEKVLGVLDEYATWIKTRYPDDIKFTITFADYVKQMNKAYNQGDDENYRVPISDDEIFQYVEVYSWSGDIEEDFRNIVTDDFSRTRIHGRYLIKELPDGNFHEPTINFMSKIIDDSEAWLIKNLPENVKVQRYGIIPMWKQVQIDIITGQIYAIAIAMGAILIIVSIIFRSLAIGFIGLIPVGSAVIAIFGVMGWANIFLEIGTSLVAAMAIGIGIDDTMYYLMTYRKCVREGMSIEGATKRTYLIAGKAILFTSIALLAGYSMLLLSNFIVIQYFALLNIVAIGATTLGALLLLPLVVVFSQKRLSVKF